MSQVICNDCQAHCTVAFHVLGMKCSSCGSYNTAQYGGIMWQQQDTETEAEPEQQIQPPPPTQH